MTPSDFLSTGRHFPFGGYRQRSSPSSARGRGGPLQFPRQPSDHSASSTPEGSSAPAPGPGVPSVAFAVFLAARLPLDPPLGGVRLTTPQTSLDVADWPVARPLSGTSSLRFDGGLSTDAGSRATRDPGISPDRTHTGWLTRACRSVTPRSPPYTQGARAAGRTRTARRGAEATPCPRRRNRKPRCPRPAGEGMTSTSSMPGEEPDRCHWPAAPCGSRRPTLDSRGRPPMRW